MRWPFFGSTRGRRRTSPQTSRPLAGWLAGLTLLAGATACAALEPAAPADIAAQPGAISMPYRLSEGGHFLIDISVNEHASLPFIVDTGATMSIIFEDAAHALNLVATDQSVLVRGLLTSGLVPVIDDIALQIGPKTFALDRVAMLEPSSSTAEATGLIGADILANHVMVFNDATMTATLLPSAQIQPNAFNGWRRIALHHQVGTYPDQGLHFTHIDLTDQQVPVLVDTGASLSIINWALATRDPDLQRLRRTLRRRVEVQGAFETRPIEFKTQLFDLVLGRHYWPQTDVIVMDFDSLAPVAPTDEPMMIAGASMFSSKTVAFDLGGDMMYILAAPGDPRPPRRGDVLRQPPETFNESGLPR